MKNVIERLADELNAMQGVTLVEDAHRNCVLTDGQKKSIISVFGEDTLAYLREIAGRHLKWHFDADTTKGGEIRIPDITMWASGFSRDDEDSYSFEPGAEWLLVDAHVDDAMAFWVKGEGIGFAEAGQEDERVIVAQSIQEYVELACASKGAFYWWDPDAPSGDGVTANQILAALEGGAGERIPVVIEEVVELEPEAAYEWWVREGLEDRHREHGAKRLKVDPAEAVAGLVAWMKKPKGGKAMGSNMSTWIGYAPTISSDWKAVREVLRFDEPLVAVRWKVQSEAFAGDPDKATSGFLDSREVRALMELPDAQALREAVGDGDTEYRPDIIPLSHWRQNEPSVFLVPKRLCPKLEAGTQWTVPWSAD